MMHFARVAYDLQKVFLFGRADQTRSGFSVHKWKVALYSPTVGTGSDIGALTRLWLMLMLPTV